MKKTALLSTLLLCAAVAQAVELKFDGQVRWRMEMTKGKTDYFDSDVDAYAVQYMRTRIGMSAMPMEGLETYVQFQDSRKLGDGYTMVEQDTLTMGLSEERAPFYSPSNRPITPDNDLYMKQAWFRWHCQLVPGLSFQAGRYEWAKADQRFFSKRNWNNYGMSHEGWNLRYENEMATVEFYWHTLLENETNAADQESYGVYISDIAAPMLPVKLDVFFDVEDAGEITMGSTDYANAMNTLGLHCEGTFMDMVRAKVNFAMQMGTNEFADVDLLGNVVEADYAGMLYGIEAAYLAHLGILEEIYIGYESFNANDDGDYGWQELYPAYHAMHGISPWEPAFNESVEGYGFNALEVGAAGALPMELNWDLSYHIFSTVEDMASGETAVGDEIDFTLARNFGKFKIDLGYTMANIDDKLEADADAFNYFYLQMTAFIK